MGFSENQVILKELLKQPRPYGSANRKQGSPWFWGPTFSWGRWLDFQPSSSLCVFSAGGLTNITMTHYKLSFSIISILDYQMVMLVASFLIFFNLICSLRPSFFSSRRGYGVSTFWGFKSFSEGYINHQPDHWWPWTRVLRSSRDKWLDAKSIDGSRGKLRIGDAPHTFMSEYDFIIFYNILYAFFYCWKVLNIDHANLWITIRSWMMCNQWMLSKQGLLMFWNGSAVQAASVGSYFPPGADLQILQEFCRFIDIDWMLAAPPSPRKVRNGYPKKSYVKVVDLRSKWIWVSRNFAQSQSQSHPMRMKFVDGKGSTKTLDQKKWLELVY